MTTSSKKPNLTHSQTSLWGINLVATVKLTPEHFIQSHQLEFISGADDLDSLVFTNLKLPSGNTISLVRHQNAPYPGTEIYLNPCLPNPDRVLAEALHLLNLSHDDFNWVHPQINLAHLV